MFSLTLYPYSEGKQPEIRNGGSTLTVHHIHTFLVHPGKGTGKAQIVGTAVSLTGGMFKAQAALQKRDGETEAKAFARLYENNLTFRKQWASVTEAKMLHANLNLHKGFDKNNSTGNGAGVETTAYDELTVLAKNLKKADPKLSDAQAFAKVYEDPANIEIVKRERGQNRPAA